LLAVLLKKIEAAMVLRVLEEAERFLLLVRSFAGTRSHIGETESFRMAHDLHIGLEGPRAVARMLAERVATHFSAAAFQNKIDDLYSEEDGKGFYDLVTLKFVLFEYEEDLRRAAKTSSSKITWEDFRGSKNSVEHVFPQNPQTGEWSAFREFTAEQRRLLTHSLGNLVAVSTAKNASLSSQPFDKKKAGTATVPGFKQGSFSELEINNYKDWTPADVLERGLKILDLIERRWRTNLGDRDSKVKLLKLDFLT
jgi:hypothetical protein